MDRVHKLNDPAHDIGRAFFGERFIGDLFPAESLARAKYLQHERSRGGELRGAGSWRLIHRFDHRRNLRDLSEIVYTSCYARQNGRAEKRLNQRTDAELERCGFREERA